MEDYKPKSQSLENGTYDEKEYGLYGFSQQTHPDDLGLYFESDRFEGNRTSSMRWKGYLIRLTRHLHCSSIS
jgi:hypothetical protein